MVRYVNEVERATESERRAPEAGGSGSSPGARRPASPPRGRWIASGLGVCGSGLGTRGRASRFGVLLGLGLAACGDSEPVQPPPPGSGTIRASISTAGDHLDSDGYTLVLDGSGQPVGLNDTITFSEVPEGIHEIELLDVAPNCAFDPTTATLRWLDAGATIQIPYEVLCGDLAYVTTLEANTVSAVATSRHTVTESIPVGTFPFGLAITPDGSRIYVTNRGSANVSVIETATNTVIGTIPVGPDPEAVAVTPDGAHVYVAESVGAQLYDIEVATNTVVDQISGVPETAALLIPPDGTRLYVGGAGEIQALSLPGHTLLGRVVVDRDVGGMAVTPDRAFVYATEVWNDVVKVIDARTLTVVASISVGSRPQGVAITPDGTFAYVVNELSRTVSVIETASRAVVATVPAGHTPVFIEITPDGELAYVPNLNGDDITVIETATHTVVATGEVEGRPVDIVFLPN